MVCVENLQTYFVFARWTPYGSLAWLCRCVAFSRAAQNTQSIDFTQTTNNQKRLTTQISLQEINCVLCWWVGLKLNLAHTKNPQIPWSKQESNQSSAKWFGCSERWMNINGFANLYTYTTIRSAFRGHTKLACCQTYNLISEWNWFRRIAWPTLYVVFFFSYMRPRAFICCAVCVFAYLHRYSFWVIADPTHVVTLFR